jgi:hypothetical protein
MKPGDEIQTPMTLAVWLGPPSSMRLNRMAVTALHPRFGRPAEVD